MCVPFVHNLKAESCSVKNVCPSRDDTVLTINNGLVEVETIQVERHCRNAKSGEPDANHRPGGEEEVQRT